MELGKLISLGIFIIGVNKISYVRCQTKVNPKVQTGRDCDIVSSISSQFLNVLTSKDSHFGRIDQTLYNINS